MQVLIKNNNGVALELLDKVNFRTKKITRDREECYIMIKGSIHQEDIVILTVHAPTNRAV